MSRPTHALSALGLAAFILLPMLSSCSSGAGLEEAAVVTVDGGFEATGGGAFGWILGGPEGSGWSLASAPVRGGSVSAMCDAGQVPQGATLWSTEAPVSEGDTVTSEVWLRSAGNLAHGADVAVELCTAKGWEPWQTMAEAFVPEPDRWHGLFLRSATAPYGATAVRLAVTLRSSEPPQARLFLDDARLDVVSFRAYAESKRGGPRLPNILWLATDTLRPSALGCYGNPSVFTPNVDALAQEGVRWTQVTSAAPWTKPSFASLFTSRYPSQHTVEESMNRLPQDLTTVAEVAKAQGYFTAAFAYSPVDGYLGAHMGFDQGFDVYYHGFGEGLPFQGLKEFLDRNEEVFERLEGGGVFLFWHIYEPHEPYVNWTPELIRNEGLLGQSDFKLFEVWRDRLPFNRQDQEYADKLYAGEATWTDRLAGEILARFKWWGLLDDLNIMLTSDHGEMLPGERDDPSFWGHERCCETVNRVPLILRFPGRAEGGRAEDDLASNLDVMPTLCNLLGWPVPDHCEGRDLLQPPGAAPTAQYAISESRRRGELSIRGPRYKLYVRNAVLTPAQPASGPIAGDELPWAVFGENATATFSLYDVANDFLETRDLADELPAVVDVLKEELRRHCARTGMFTPEKNPLAEEGVVSEEAVEQLRSVGYL